MKTLKNLQCSLCWIFICILILISSEVQAQHKKMSTRDLAVESTTVMYGKCSSVKSAWNQEQDIIFTEITIVPEGYIKGNLGSETVITVPGGRVGDIIYEVSEMPVFETGEEVFAFIYEHPSGKNLVTGGFQGKIRIEKDPVTGKRIINSSSSKDEVRSANLKSLDVKPATGVKDVTLLEDFIREVEGYLK